MQSGVISFVIRKASVRCEDVDNSKDSNALPDEAETHPDG